MIDVLEADEQLGTLLRVDDLGDLIADLLNIRLVQDVPIDELDAGDAVLFGDTKS